MYDYVCCLFFRDLKPENILLDFRVCMFCFVSMYLLLTEHLRTVVRNISVWSWHYGLGAASPLQKWSRSDIPQYGSSKQQWLVSLLHGTCFEFAGFYKISTKREPIRAIGFTSRLYMLPYQRWFDDKITLISTLNPQISPQALISI